MDPAAVEPLSSDDEMEAPRVTRPREKSSELLVVLDCCFTNQCACDISEVVIDELMPFRWQKRQREIPYKERDELRCSIVPIRISFNPTDFQATIAKAIK